MKRSEFDIIDGRLYLEGKPLTNFVPEIRGVFCRPGGRQPEELQIGYVVCGTSNPRTVTVRGARLRFLDFEALDIACRYEGIRRKSQQMVNDYLRQQVAAALENGTCGTYLDAPGWHDSPSPVFAAGEELIGAPPGQAFCLNEKFTGVRLVADATLPEPAVEGLVRAFQRTPEAMAAFAFTLYTSVRSLLQRAGLSTNSVLYITGTQGYGKSQLAKRFCTLYDNTEWGFPANSFDAGSTFAGIRDALAQQRDQIVLLDDLCHSSVISEERERQKLLSKVIRSATNTTAFGKKAVAQNAEINCTAGLVVTAEMLPTSASELTRCILLHLDQPLTAFQIDDRLYAATVFRHFLVWFAARRESELQRFHEDFDVFVEARQNTSELRLRIGCWQQVWVFDCFLRFALDVNAISEKAASNMSRTFEGLINRAFAYTVSAVRQLTPVQPEAIAAMAMQELQAKHIPAIRHRGCLYVRLEVLTEQLRRVSQRPSLDPKTISAALRSAGMLETDASGKNTKKLDGRRYLVIRCRQ